MNFWVLSKKHKKMFAINQGIVIFALVICMIIAWLVNDVEMPNSISKITASVGFVTPVAVLLLAILNRASALFKIRSLGFIVFFIMFATLKIVVDVLVWTTGLMALVLLLDDIIMKPIWNNIWWNQYTEIAMRQQK